MRALADHARSRSGLGELATALVAGESAVVALAAKSPLKLVASRERGPCVRVHAATFGGGLLAGDEVELVLDVRAGSTLSLGTSAPSKVYRSEGGRESVQRVQARVDDGALLALTPQPLTCFTGARYVQRVGIDLAAGASLLLTDTLTSGRSARGERWAFERYDARTRIRLENRLILHEALRLEGASVGARMGAFEAVSLAVLAGPRLAGAIAAVRDEVAARAARRDEQVRVAVSTLPWGLVVRAAGLAVEPLERELQALLAPAFANVSSGDSWHGPW